MRGPLPGWRPGPRALLRRARVGASSPGQQGYSRGICFGDPHELIPLLRTCHTAHPGLGHHSQGRVLSTGLTVPPPNSSGASTGAFRGAHPVPPALMQIERHPEAGKGGTWYLQCQRGTQPVSPPKLVPPYSEGCCPATRCRPSHTRSKVPRARLRPARGAADVHF